MDSRMAPISRFSWLKFLAGVAVVGAFFVAFALGTGRSVPPERGSTRDDLRALRERLATAVDAVQEADAPGRAEAAREVLRIARGEVVPALDGEARAAFAARTAELAGDPRRNDAFARKADRLLGFLDACIAIEAAGSPPPDGPPAR